MLINPVIISPLSPKLIGVGGVASFDRLAHGLKWAVDTDNMAEVGTTTTLIDYHGNNNISNPSAVNQPLTVLNVLNGKSILRFTTNDILTKSVANWMATDTSGVMTVVFKPNAVNFKSIFATSDEITTRIWDISTDGFGRPSHLHNNGETQSARITGSTIFNTSKYYIFSLAHNGINLKMFVSSSSEPISINTFSVDVWLNDLSTSRDNITLGGRKASSLNYCEADIYGAYYGDYINDGEIVQLHDEIKKELGI